MTISSFLVDTDLKKNEVQLLIQAVTGLTITDIIAHPELELQPEQLEKLLCYVEKRKMGLPIEYITGKRGFYKDTFRVSQGVLIPQPDTEILVEEAVKLALSSNEKNYRVLDLCTGTGCIGISFAKEVANHFDYFKLVLCDISPVAIKCCEENARNLMQGIDYKIVKSDLFENLENETYNLILTNPPYIKSEIIPTLENDVQQEPILALDGGESGLDLITKICEHAPAFLTPQGYLLMEIGYDQGKTVSNLFSSNNFKDVCVIKDLGNRDRVVKGRI